MAYTQCQQINRTRWSSNLFSWFNENAKLFDLVGSSEILCPADLVCPFNWKRRQI
jgi:hypothetical protein